SSGAVVATAVTDSFGRFSFTDQTGIPGTGYYTVSVVLSSGYIQTSQNPGTIALSRGNLDIEGVSFGLAAMSPPTSLTNSPTRSQAGTSQVDRGADSAFWTACAPDIVWWSYLTTPGHRRG